MHKGFSSSCSVRSPNSSTCFGQVVECAFEAARMIPCSKDTHGDSEKVMTMKCCLFRCLESSGILWLITSKI